MKKHIFIVIALMISLVLTGQDNQSGSKRGTQLYNVGDQKTFWRYDLSNMPPKYIQIQATCRGVGDHSYIFIDDVEWGTSMGQANVDTIMKYLEDMTLNSSDMGIIEMDSMYFGDIPDMIDGDPRIIIFYTDLGMFAGNYFDGYFSPHNQLTEVEAVAINKHSNECEMIYMSCNDIFDPAGYMSLGDIAHQVQHLIHWSYDTDEAGWVDDGCSELARVLFGWPREFTEFNDLPNNNLLNFGMQSADYEKLMLFFTYLSEQYGGNEFIRKLVSDTSRSITGLSNTLDHFGETDEFQDILVNWAVANYVDDPSFSDGKYGYSEIELPAFGLNYKFTGYPVKEPTSSDPSAALYYQLSTTYTDLDVEFIPDGGTWKIALLGFENDVIKEVTIMDNLVFTKPHPTSYNLTKLILVIVNTEISDVATDFVLHVNKSADIGEQSCIGNLKAEVFPNPVRSSGKISFELAEPLEAEINIYDMRGIPVENIAKGIFGRGMNELQWTCNISPGTYILSIETENGITGTRIEVVK